MHVGVQIQNEREPKRWKRVGFVVVAVLFTLFGFFVLEGATEALEPWVPSDCAGCDPESVVPDSYRWLAASHGALLAFLFGGSLISMLRRPFEKPLLLHFYAVGHLVFLIGFAITAPRMAMEKVFVYVMFLLVLTILYAFYHNRASAVKLATAPGYDKPLLILTIVAAIVLVPVAVHAGIEQLSESNEQFRWGEHAVMLIVLLYAGFLASSRRAGSLALGIVASITYMYLGASAIAVPEHSGSWGIAGGTAAILYGAIFAGFLLYRQRSR